MSHLHTVLSLPAPSKPWPHPLNPGPRNAHFKKSLGLDLKGLILFFYYVVLIFSFLAVSPYLWLLLYKFVNVNGLYI